MLHWFYTETGGNFAVCFAHFRGNKSDKPQRFRDNAPIIWLYRIQKYHKLSYYCSQSETCIISRANSREFYWLYTLIISIYYVFKINSTFLAHLILNVCRFILSLFMIKSIFISPYILLWDTLSSHLKSHYK
jgi:hypothetical protein